MTRNQKIVFCIILAAAVFLIFFRLGRQDLLSDDGHYALRAYGYFDYMESQRQTTPLQWFGERPWWSYLSFHDHPPMYFFTQHIFFKLFGPSAAVSRLTSALAALGSVIVIFFLARKWGGTRLGLLAMGLLVLNNQFIWMGRIGHLESLFVFWLLLSLLYLVKALQGNPKNYLWAGLFFGFTMLTKYTLLFMLPAIVIYLVWRERRVFREKKFWLGILVFLLVASPLLIYNLKMFQTRGHFDVQFSDLLRQRHNDWTGLQGRTGGFQMASAREALGHLGSGMSWPYFVLTAAALAAVCVFAHRQGQRWLYLPALLFAVTLFFLMYVGGANRWLVVLSPFAALLLAAAAAWLSAYRVLPWLGGILAIYFLVFIWNGNHAIAGSKNRMLASDLRMENYGYNQLDQWMRGLVEKKSVPYRTREAMSWVWFNQIKPGALSFLKDKREYGEFNSLLIYDANTKWFPMVWTFGRYRIYRGIPSMSSFEYASLVQDKETRDLFNSLGFQEIYYIHAGPEVRAQLREDFPEGGQIRSAFEAGGVRPEIIYDLQGREAFYIYHSANVRL